MPMRHSDPNVELGINKLLELGALTEEGLAAFGKVIRSLQSLGGGMTAPVAPVSRSRRPPGTGKKRGRRGKFNVTKEELDRLYIKEGKSAKAIAEQYGVSTQTVALKASKYRLLKRGVRKAAASRGGGGKKANSKKAAKKKERKQSA